jgi:hypothetical protein
MRSFRLAKALTPHVFELIGTGQKDEQRLVVSTLTYLKSLPGAAQRAEATHFKSTFTDCKSCGDVGLSSKTRKPRLGEAGDRDASVRRSARKRMSQTTNAA